MILKWQNILKAIHQKLAVQYIFLIITNMTWYNKLECFSQRGIVVTSMRCNVLHLSRLHPYMLKYKTKLNVSDSEKKVTNALAYWNYSSKDLFSTCLCPWTNYKIKMISFRTLVNDPDFSQMNLTHWNQTKHSAYPISWSGKSYWRGRLSTVDLLMKVGCFVKKIKFQNEKELI